MIEQKVYVFQNWKFGSDTLEQFKKWDKEGKILGKLKAQDIYVHTDSQSGFLIISLNKRKLLEIAERRKQSKIKELQRSLSFIQSMKFL